MASSCCNHDQKQNHSHTEKSCCGHEQHEHHDHPHHGHNHDHGDGHHQPSRFTSQTASLTGLHCGDCATKLEKVISRIDGVSQIDVNFATSKMSVGYDEAKTDFHTIVASVRKLGYDVAQTEEKEGSARLQAEQPFWKRNNKALTTASSGVLFLLAWIPSLMGMMEESTAAVLYAAAIVIGGYRIAKSGIYGLRSRTVGMDFLMTIAAVGAAVIGQWGEGAAVVFLFALGETLEAYTMDRTRNSIRSLMDLAPNTATVRRSGQTTMTLPVEQIAVGDIMLVKPGEKIAMDGKIAKGYSAINQAPITGESIPVEKGAGDDVFAGTINQQGALEIEVTKLSKDNTLSRIIHLVEEAQAQKAPSQRFVDVFSKYYTPAVIAVAVGIATIPTLMFGQPFDIWFYRALMLLVVSCPCALVISTPVSIVSAIGNAARNGILIKGGAHLERLGAITAVAFDKTGTLTAGVPQVEEVIPLSGSSSSEVLAIAASVEAMSEHPVAEAIVRKARQEGIGIPECSDFTSVTGKGAQAEIDGTVYHIGNPRWFRDDLGASLGLIQEQIDRLQEKGQTVMVLGTKEQVMAIITVADEIRANSKAAIKELQAVGMKKIVMLTGDNQGTAKAVAAKLGGIDYRAELLPQDKVSSIKELMEQEKGVAMVGDGVNDAPALAVSTVGIAMGAAGTDTALETADVALMADDLSKLPYAARLSRRALRIIKQNIAFSLLVKAVFMALIFMGWSTLWMAVLADTGSSLLVIANGMRLLRTQRNPRNRQETEGSRPAGRSAQHAAR
ncbi:MAG TPA: heavy metal translocating P-type ATPase [Paenibacillus sp.]|uniref:heavy metal translocating P-type ATPase n=1 Tax=Paenibacillus sp. TaxID=58172 RepID=UPI002BDE2AB7|nr:heavy metal translocating P-type ATPase [Paenibacillus sp.]HUC91510.1 heavy metal translocating P-type ATPase [Paenibacillus sp.]